MEPNEGTFILHGETTKITSLYGGPLEFLFVVESTEDTAYHAMISEFEDDVDAKVVVAGLSTTCRQKIHNQLVGVDDDVTLHPGSIGALTREMEKNLEIFIQTGYRLDLPSGSLGSYCIYEYHMVHNYLWLYNLQRKNKGGVVVEVEGLKEFVPFSQISMCWLSTVWAETTRDKKLFPKL